jgi:hypothetical protein
MSLVFKSTTPEIIVHDYGAAKYTAVRDGMNWMITGHNENGTPVRKPIDYTPDRFGAAALMLQFAMEQHDDCKRARPSPKLDRVVSVDGMGNYSAAPIYGGIRRW